MSLTVSRWMRVVIALILIVLLLASALLLTQLAGNISAIWLNLGQESPVLQTVFLFILGFFALIALLILWWAFKPRKKTAQKKPQQEVLSQQQLEQKVDSVQQYNGLDVGDVRLELNELSRRQQIDELFVAFFGPVSAGKSSLIKAICQPDESIEIDVRAGSTKNVQHYPMQIKGTKVNLTDVPGLLDVHGHLSRIARDEARRAHAVVYVTDKEPGRDQYQELRELQSLQRPFVIVLNKTDWYNNTDLQAIIDRTQNMLPDMTVITASSETEREVTVVAADGKESIQMRKKPADVSALMYILENFADQQQSLTNQRDASMVKLGQHKLDQTLVSYRAQKSHDIISAYMKKAMIGAMAAISPGTDILIQGYLGMKMVKALCKLHEIPASDVDIDETIQVVSKQAGTKLPVLLALTGNVFKAFPGVGTVTGGLLHAVSYALIFEKLGVAVHQVISNEQKYDSNKILNQFGEALDGNLESRVQQLAKLVWQSRKQKH